MKQLGSPRRVAVGRVCRAALLVVLTAGSAAQAQQSYSIGLADELRISVWKDDELTVDTVVRPDGKITVPLVGEIPVLGRTPAEVQAELTKRLEEYVTAPAVSVIVEAINSRKVYVTGNVNNSGEYDLVQPLRLMHVIAMAGGLNEFAKRDSIVVLREGANGVERIEVSVKAITSGNRLESNLLLRPGDTIFVP